MTPSAAFSERGMGPGADALRVLFQDGPVSGTDRRVIARGFSNACGELARKIPVLSPRETDWLDQEIREGRIATVFDTVEFAERQLRDALLACQQVSNGIDRDNVPELFELAMWSSLIDAILNPYLETHIITLMNVKTPDITVTDRGLVSLFSDMARLIARKILTPSLVGLAQRE
jgi:hypothetical protein